MKKVILGLLGISLQLYCFDEAKYTYAPPDYSEPYVQHPSSSSISPAQKIPHDFFLDPLPKKNTGLMQLRAHAYFQGISGISQEPLMAFALLQIATDCNDTKACVDLADKLTEHDLIEKTTLSQNRASIYLCTAIKYNHQNNTLKKLQKLTGKNITEQEALAQVAVENPSSKFLVDLVCTSKNLHGAQELHQAGLDLLRGTKTGLQPDPLRALAVFCYAYHKFPDSPLGAQALAEFMITQEEHQKIFKKNKMIAHHYADVARLRGLPEDTQQQLTAAIEKCVEPQKADSSLGLLLWNSLASIFE